MIVFNRPSSMDLVILLTISILALLEAVEWFPKWSPFLIYCCQLTLFTFSSKFRSEDAKSCCCLRKLFIQVGNRQVSITGHWHVTMKGHSQAQLTEYYHTRIYISVKRFLTCDYISWKYCRRIHNSQSVMCHADYTFRQSCLFRLGTFFHTVGCNFFLQ